MHTLGKVFLVLIALLSPVAVLLIAKTLDVRNSWMESIDKKQESIVQKREQLEKVEKELAQTQAELARLRLTWDSLYVSKTTRTNQTGEVTASVGTDQGFGVRASNQPAPIVQAFAIAPAGPLYIGPFEVRSAANRQAILNPLFPVGPGDSAGWPNGEWHLWDAIPAEAPSRLVDLKNEIVRREEVVDSRTATLALQTAAVQEAESHLQARLQELFGNPQAVQLEESPEVRVGLVQAINDSTAARNQALTEQDELRNTADQQYRRLTQLLDENRELVQRLPGIGPETAEVSTTD